MSYSAVGWLVTLALSMLVAPLLAVALPVQKVSTIGFLNPGSTTGIAQRFEAFMQDLRAPGNIEGPTIAIERRDAENRPEQLPALAAELATHHSALRGAA